MENMHAEEREIEDKISRTKLTGFVDVRWNNNDDSDNEYQESESEYSLSIESII